VRLRKGDELRELEESFNVMTESLRNFIEEDNRIAGEVSEIVKDIEKQLVSGELNNDELGKIKEKLVNISAKLKQIGGHFKLKNKDEKAIVEESENSEAKEA
jgi:methyl-accepting chemotaxis protein